MTTVLPANYPGSVDYRLGLSPATQKAIKGISTHCIISASRQGKLRSIPGVDDSMEEEILLLFAPFIRPNSTQTTFDAAAFLKSAGEDFPFSNVEYENRSEWHDLEYQFFNTACKDLDKNYVEILLDHIGGLTNEQISSRHHVPIVVLGCIIENTIANIKNHSCYDRLKKAFSLSYRYKSPEAFFGHVIHSSPMVRGEISNQCDYDIFIAEWAEARFLDEDKLLENIISVSPILVLSLFMSRHGIDHDCLKTQAAQDLLLTIVKDLPASNVLNFIEKHFINPADVGEKPLELLLATPIDEIDMSKRLYNSLSKTNSVYRNKRWVPYKVQTIGDVTELTKKEALSLRNMGEVSLLELESILEKFGLEFKAS